MNLLVLGQGTSGQDVVRWALAHPERVSQVTLYGGAKSSPTPETLEFEAAGVTCVYATEEVAGSFDVCVASPGISEFSPFFASASAHAIQIMGEPEFSYRLSPERWIGITGTNGKTTTTALTAHLLESAGMDADAVGNIGDTPVSRIDHRAPGSWFVLELPARHHLRASPACRGAAQHHARPPLLAPQPRGVRPCQVPRVPQHG